MCIGPGNLTEMLNHCNNFIDGKTVKISDIDLELISCNGGKKVRNDLTPDKAIVRN
jgi:hypothetical protein